MSKKTKKIEYADLFWLFGTVLGAAVTGACLYFEKEAYCGMLCPLFGILGSNIGNLVKKKKNEEQGGKQENAGNEK